MPYTNENDRRFVDKSILVDEIPFWTAGDLTYALTRVVWHWVKGKRNYLNCAIVIGCLVCTAFEFYRRVVAPYEDTKIKENGDVYVESLPR